MTKTTEARSIVNSNISSQTAVVGTNVFMACMFESLSVLFPVPVDGLIKYTICINLSASDHHVCHKTTNKIRRLPNIVASFSGLPCHVVLTWRALFALVLGLKLHYLYVESLPWEKYDSSGLKVKLAAIGIGRNLPLLFILRFGYRAPSKLATIWSRKMKFTFSALRWNVAAHTIKLRFCTD